MSIHTRSFGRSSKTPFLKMTRNHRTFEQLLQNNRGLLTLPVLLGIFFVILLLILFSVAFCDTGRFEAGKGEVVIRTAVSEILVSVEAAADPESRARGLMGREALGSEEGMFFVFENDGRRNFWMKNMLLSLDIIFISNAKKIVGIAKEVPPCEEGAVCPHVSSAPPAQYVLEVPAGFADSHGLEIGNLLSFEYPFRDTWISCGNVYVQ